MKQEDQYRLHQEVSIHRMINRGLEGQHEGVVMFKESFADRKARAHFLRTARRTRGHTRTATLTRPRSLSTRIPRSTSRPRPKGRGPPRHHVT